MPLTTGIGVCITSPRQICCCPTSDREQVDYESLRNDVDNTLGFIFFSEKHRLGDQVSGEKKIEQKFVFFGRDASKGTSEGAILFAGFCDRNCCAASRREDRHAITFPTTELLKWCDGYILRATLGGMFTTPSSASHAWFRKGCAPPLTSRAMHKRASGHSPRPCTHLSMAKRHRRGEYTKGEKG